MPLSVRDVSRATGLGRETLRYYEKTGLLPSPARGANGYRRYCDDDLRRIDFIRKTKKAGFRIREIRELIALKEEGKATCQVGHDIAQERIARIDRQIESLLDVRRMLEDFARRCEECGLDQPCSLSFYCGPSAADTARGTRRNTR